MWNNGKYINQSRLMNIILIELGFAEIFPIGLQLSILMALDYLLSYYIEFGVRACVMGNFH